MVKTYLETHWFLLVFYKTKFLLDKAISIVFTIVLKLAAIFLLPKRKKSILFFASKKVASQSFHLCKQRKPIISKNSNHNTHLYVEPNTLLRSIRKTRITRRWFVWNLHHRSFPNLYQTVAYCWHLSFWTNFRLHWWPRYCYHARQKFDCISLWNKFLIKMISCFQWHIQK